MARTSAIGLRRDPQPPIPIVMPERSSPATSSGLMTVTRSALPVHELLPRRAGHAGQVELEREPPRLHAKVIELNLIAPLHVAQAANTVMQGQPGGGSIIMIGSVSGTRPSPETAAYGAAKAGLHHLATTLAVEWAPKVRVNSVVPGPVATESAVAAHYDDVGTMTAIAQTMPLGRLVTPDEVADACLFLASPLAAGISGASLLLHGGGERPA
jgi:NAD(P)-dependent dehydrogenase (short-subunit alcohol dehydrogenase family)